MPMYNLTGYSDNYSDTSGRLWQFKRNEIEGNVDLTVDDNHIPNKSSSFKYKSSFITNRNVVKIVVPLKYLRNFWRSLEIPLTWNSNCVLSSLVGNLAFTITFCSSCYFKNWRQCKIIKTIKRRVWKISLLE